MRVVVERVYVKGKQNVSFPHIHYEKQLRNMPTVGDRGGENPYGKYINLKATTLHFSRTSTIAPWLATLSSNSWLRTNPRPLKIRG